MPKYHRIVTQSPQNFRNFCPSISQAAYFDFKEASGDLEVGLANRPFDQNRSLAKN